MSSSSRSVSGYFCGFLGRWSVAVDVEFVTLISFEVVVPSVLLKNPATTE